MKTVKALKWFSDGVISMHKDEIRDIDETKATQYISEGYVEEYTEPIVPQGKITITENGEGIDVSQYAEADVNVSGGSSDYSTATMTITTDGAVQIIVPCLDEGISGMELLCDISLNGALSNVNKTVLLYNGKCEAKIDGTVTISGNISKEYGTENIYIITGNCTVSIVTS